MRSLIVTFLAVSFIALQATAIDWIMPDDASLLPKENLTIEEQNADLEFLMNALDNGYSGKLYLPADEYLNLLKRLNNIKIGLVFPQSSQEFCRQIQRALEPVPDVHLAVHLVQDNCQKFFPKANVGSNVLADKNLTWGVVETKHLDRTYKILAIAKFVQASLKDWNGFLDEVVKLKNQSSIILDMRGNPGGDDTMGKRMAKILYGIGSNEDMPYPVEKQVSLWTPAARAAFYNYRTITLLKMKMRGQDIPEEFFSLQKQSLEFYNSHGKDSLPDLEEKMIPVAKAGEKVYSGKLYILIDRHCGSACETTLQALEGLPQVVKVGENTTGTVTYINAGLMYLQNSRVILTIPTRASIFRDGRVVEKIGYAPDIQVQTGQDALEVTLKLIQDASLDTQ